jgi:hypothetical protein
MSTYADYYIERVREASAEQGIDDLCKALTDLGIKATSEQTGGFTMCAYVELNAEHYIYANLYGASVYTKDDYSHELAQYDEKQTAQQIALDVRNYINK